LFDVGVGDLVGAGGVVRGTIDLPKGPLSPAAAAGFDFMLQVTETPLGLGDVGGGIGDWLFSGVQGYGPAFEAAGFDVVLANAVFARPRADAPFGEDQLFFGTDPGISTFLPELSTDSDLDEFFFFFNFSEPTRFEARIPLPLPAALLLSGVVALAALRHRRPSAA